MTSYMKILGLVESMHKLLLDAIKDELVRLDENEINSVQALLLFNIGNNKVTVGELKSRGYYQGTNPGYSLRQLEDKGYIHRQKCAIDRRSVYVGLTDQGREIRDIVDSLFQHHAKGLQDKGVISADGVAAIAAALHRVELHWIGGIRHIY